MTLAVLASRTLTGLCTHTVRVEVHLGTGLPIFTLVGLPDIEVRESRERVRSAIVNSGFDFPAGRVTINLSPGDLPKASPRFDLPIALGILLASGQLVLGPDKTLDTLVLAGELSLSGAVVPIADPLALALGVAREGGRHTLVLPTVSAAQAARVPDLPVLAAASLAAVAAHLAGYMALPRAQAIPVTPSALDVCLSDVRGQPAARRALEVAAAGGHSLLMIGPPGVGKSMLAQRMPSLLPVLTGMAALEAAAIAHQAGVELPFGLPPFRAPHHSASVVALSGGGRPLRPGEVTLAHHGVLFLDELPEFDRRALQVLREPLETGRIEIARAAQRAEYPARFQLLAAMNPCPCGWRGHPARNCRCTPEQATRYLGKVGGPLYDRIDLHLWLPPLVPERLADPPGETSAAVRARVQASQRRQFDRQGCLNAGLSGAALTSHCALSGAETQWLVEALRRLQASARSAHRVLRVARSVADLRAAEVIGRDDLAEALQYRDLGTKGFATPIDRAHPVRR